MAEDTVYQEGVRVSDIDGLLTDLSYPLSKSALVTEHGDATIARTNAGPIAIRELFDGTGEDTFDSPTALHESVLNLMPRESVGRQRYSDRAGALPVNLPGPPDRDANVSF